MKRWMAASCCVILCLSWRVCSAQQQANTPLPPAATGILVQLDREILASKKKAAEALEKVLKDTTKKGDLAGAMAVKQAADRLNAEIATMTQTRSGRGAADIVGRWKGQGADWTVEFRPDGTAVSELVTGTWAVNGGAVEAKFSDGTAHFVERTADGWAGVIKQHGQTRPVRYIRVP